MTSPASHPATRSVGARLVVALAVGTVAGSLTTVLGRSVAFDVMAAWTVGAAVYGAWTWLVVRPMDERDTATHARQEDPSVALSEATVLGGTLASLAGVGLLLVAGRHKSSSNPEALLGTGSVIASWFLVHLTYMARYARLYYGNEPGARGIDFEGGEPDYYDFAYVAFDLGMTYQIADTNLKNRQMRRLVLGHSLLSYLLGVGVVATTINLVVSLASG